MSDQTELPKKQVHWTNDYADEIWSIWYDSRRHADRAADEPFRIAVIRREWVEGQLPQYFTEEV